MRTGIRSGNAHVETVHVRGDTPAGTLCGRKPAKYGPVPQCLIEARGMAQNACYKVCKGCEKRGPRCVQCGGAVEQARWVYVHPTCYRCLPPPEPLPIAPLNTRPDCVRTNR